MRAPGTTLLVGIAAGLATAAESASVDFGWAGDRGVSGVLFGGYTLTIVSIGALIVMRHAVT